MRTIGPSLILAFLASVASAAEGDQAAFFETRVRPLLARECYACHTATHMGGLELNSRQALLKGGNSGPAIVPGKPDQSLLVQAINYTHVKLRMPPSGQLREAEIRDLTEWIQQGAVWPDTPAAKNAKQFRITAADRAFWSFCPIRKPAVPSTANRDWPAIHD